MGSHRSVEHGNVVYQHILNDVDLVRVLAKRPNRDTMRAIAVEILDQNFGAIWFEGDTICRVVSRLQE